MQTKQANHANTLSDSQALRQASEETEGETWAKYRPMYYVIEQPVDEGLLLYHTMTKAMLLLTPEEAEVYKTNPTALTQLIEQWFLVPESHDDRLLSRQIRDVARMLEKKSDAITSYTILTTTDCNARCFYCYEMGRPRIPMSKETAYRQQTISSTIVKVKKYHYTGSVENHFTTRLLSLSYANVLKKPVSIIIQR